MIIFEKNFRIASFDFLIKYNIYFFSGLGQGILYPATNLALSTYFIKKRSIAMGIAVTVSGLGPTIIPYVCNYLLEQFETGGTVLILGAISLHALIGACLLQPMAKRSSDLSINTGSSENTKVCDFYYIIFILERIRNFVRKYSNIKQQQNTSFHYQCLAFRQQVRK